MINIKTNDIETLKEVCEFLAYEVARYQNPNAFSVSEEMVCGILKCDGLEVYVE